MRCIYANQERLKSNKQVLKHLFPSSQVVSTIILSNDHHSTVWCCVFCLKTDIRSYFVKLFKQVESFC